MQTQIPCEQTAAILAVGSGDLLGHWSRFQVTLIGLAALWIAALVMGNLPSLHKENRMLRQLYNLACSSATIKAYICRLGDWLKILKLAAKLTILYLKTRYLRRKLRILLDENIKLRSLQINHVLGQSGGRGDSDNLFGSIGGAHNSGGAKWPND